MQKLSLDALARGLRPAGDLLVVPARSHRLEAVEDAAVLLTVAKRG